MNMRKIAAAAGFATGAALAFAPLASADTSSDWLTSIDGLLIGGALPAADTTSTLDLAISFDGTPLVSDGNATATTLPGQFGLAIASGDDAKAVAEGGFGDSASAFGTNALAEAGSTATGANDFNFDSATDIGNNADPSTYPGAADGAYAGGGSLIGGVDSGASSNDTAQVIGNMGTDSESGFPGDGGNSGAFAGDSALIGDGAKAGNGDTAYTSGDINGFGDGSAAVGGSNDSAYTTGTETGTNEGAFAGIGNNDSATADTNYSVDDNGVSATGGNNNLAFAYGPANSDASAGGGNNDIAYISDPFGTKADTATAGFNGNSDLAEVLYAHGNATASGADNVTQIITPFGTVPAAATASADPAATDLTSTVSSEISSLNSIFETDATLAGDGRDIIQPTATQPFDTISLTDAPHTGTPTLLDYELYGVNPIANSASDPGAYNVYNGALTEFYDAYNSELYGLLNSNALIPEADVFGSPTVIDAALGTVGATDMSAATTFFDAGLADLAGFFGI